MIRTASVRELKNKLNAFLRDVRGGDIVLISDRGRVIAELRQPTIGSRAGDPGEVKKWELVEAGVLEPGLPNDPDLYRTKSAPALPTEIVDAALAFVRGDG